MHDSSLSEEIYLRNPTECILCTVSPGLTVATFEAPLTTTRKTSPLTVMSPKVPCTEGVPSDLYSAKSTESAAENSTMQRADPEPLLDRDV